MNFKVHPINCICNKCKKIRKEDTRIIKFVWLFYAVIFIIGAIV